MAKVQDSSAKSKGGGSITVSLPLESVSFAAPPPDLFSQRNVEAFTGIPERPYLDMLRDPSFPLPVMKFGKLRLVERAAFLAWLRERASAPAQRPAAANDGGELSGADEVLAEVGLERTASTRRGRR